MTFRERITTLLHQALTADEAYMDACTNEAAFAAIIAIEILRDRIGELFLEESEFANDVSLRFDELIETGELPISAFPRSGNLRLTLVLANGLNQDQLDMEVPPDMHDMSLSPEPNFEGAYLASGTPLSMFAYENSNRPSDSIAFFDLSPLAPAINLDEANPPQMIVAIVCLLVGAWPHPLEQARYTVSSCADANARISYLKYHILLEGHLLFNPVPSPNYNALEDIASSLTATSLYSQFREPFEILSEVNSRKTIIDSFLSCYHTLENYMIRARIVKVESNNVGPSLFGIRHFKSMGLAVAGTEQAHFTALLNSCWEKIVGQSTLGHFTDEKIQRMLALQNFSVPDFQEFLVLTTVKEAGKPVNINNIGEVRGIVPKLLYQVRCSIVHNKETEYHLSNRELKNETRRMILADLCITVMQRLAFGLPSVAHPNPISYSRPSLQLY